MLLLYVFAILVCVCNVKAVGEFFAVCFYHLYIIQLSVIFCICGILSPRYCQEITRKFFRRFNSSLLGRSAILNISPRKSTKASLGPVKQMSIAISNDFDMFKTQNLHPQRYDSYIKIQQIFHWYLQIIME